MVLSNAVSEKEAKEGQDFFPLVVDLRESFTAGGRFPGGFLKREGRPSDGETLTSRLIDRSLRPLFPEGYLNETQIICQVFRSEERRVGKECRLQYCVDRTKNSGKCIVKYSTAKANRDNS